MLVRLRAIWMTNHPRSPVLWHCWLVWNGGVGRQCQWMCHTVAVILSSARCGRQPMVDVCSFLMLIETQSRYLLSELI